MGIQKVICCRDTMKIEGSEMHETLTSSSINV